MIQADVLEHRDLALTHNDYRIRGHWSGQISHYAGSWFHAHYSDVLSRVNNMRRIALDSGTNIVATVAYLPNGARKVAFIYDNRNLEAQESVILWIMPA